MTVRVAVVGSGPAGFYAAGQLLNDKEFDVTVDMFDRLPTPFGLVRAGVAPDHPKIKSVTRVFDKTAAKPGFRYYGNVQIGRDVTPAELDDWYDAVIYAHGVGAGKTVDIPGRDLPGNHAAAAIVGWYNGHPDHRYTDPDLSGARAVVIGNGNVAIDVARMLALPAAGLATTDIADHALNMLWDSGIEEVVVLGRRGPEHAAFTHPELLELGRLDGVGIVVDGDLPDLEDEKLATLAEFAARSGQASMPRRIVLRFNTTPIEIRGDRHVAEVVLDNGETLRAGLVVHAVGYTGTPLDGLPFDDVRGVIPNHAGRIAPGRYTAGWIKRGPSGVIGTNRACAQETVDTLLRDLRDGKLVPQNAVPGDEVHRILIERVADLVDYDAWNAIDTHERDHGAPYGRPRIKITNIPDMIAVANLAPHGPVTAPDPSLL